MCSNRRPSHVLSPGGTAYVAPKGLNGRSGRFPRYTHRAPTERKPAYFNKIKERNSPAP